MNPIPISETATEKVTEVLKIPGSVVLIPTETVYGLASVYGDDVAAERIYHMKSRDPNKRLQLLVNGIPMLEQLGAVLDERARKLIRIYCPGPLMLIVPSVAGPSIGFRIPGHPLVLGVINALNRPLAATSANRSGDPNVLRIEEALNRLTSPPDLTIDGGDLPSDAQGSTIVDLTASEMRLIRQGAIPFAEIQTKV